MYGTKWQAICSLIREARLFADLRKIPRYVIFSQTPHKEVLKTGYFRYNDLEWYVEPYEYITEEEKERAVNNREAYIQDLDWHSISEANLLEDNQFYKVELSDGTILPNLYFSAELGTFAYPNGQAIFIEDVLKFQQKEREDYKKW